MFFVIEEIQDNLIHEDIYYLAHAIKENKKILCGVDEKDARRLISDDVPTTGIKLKALYDFHGYIPLKAKTLHYMISQFNVDMSKDFVKMLKSKDSNFLYSELINVVEKANEDYQTKNNVIMEEIVIKMTNNDISLDDLKKFLKLDEE